MIETVMTKADRKLRKLAQKQEKVLGRNEIGAQRLMWLWLIPVALGLIAIFDKRKKIK